MDRPELTRIELESAFGLDAPKRHSYFVKRVADWEVAWGLGQDSWALVADDDGRVAFPLWPAAEFAAVCARDSFAGAVPERVGLSDLLHELLINLERDGLLVAVFPTPSNKGMLESPLALAKSLNQELRNYE